MFNSGYPKFRGACDCGWMSDCQRDWRFEAFQDAERHHEAVHPRWSISAKEEH